MLPLYSLGAANIIVRDGLIGHLRASGVRLFVCDGPQVLKKQLLSEAQTMGVRVRMVEIEVKPEVAQRRWKARDGDDFKAGKQNVWNKLRAARVTQAGWERLPAAGVGQLLRALAD